MRHTEKEKLLIKELYLEGNNSGIIHKKTSIPKSTIGYIIKQSKIARSKSECKVKYHLDKNYFTKIDNKEKAYIYGFLCADGCILAKHSRIVVELNTKDIEILELIKFQLNSNNPIHIRKRKIKGKEYESATLTLISKNLVYDIQKYGCSERKSLSLKYPKIDKEYEWHFIRGYFDGDGNISKSSLQAYICVSYEFGLVLQNRLKKIGIESYLYTTKSKIFRLRITKKESCKKFLDKIYFQSDNIKLNRKYLIYKNHGTTIL